MPKVVALDKITDSYLAAQRGKWQAVKTKHAAAIKAKKLNFNKNLGGMLDKRKAPYKAIRAWKKGDSLLVIRGHLNTIKANAKSIEAAVKAYQKLIVGLGDPAEKELRGALSTISADVVNVDKAYIDSKKA